MPSEYNREVFGGEIVGPDNGRFAVELRCRQRAAEFVAKQIRLAEAEDRDVTPVPSALAEIPVLGNRLYPQGDFVQAGFGGTLVNIYAPCITRSTSSEPQPYAALRTMGCSPSTTGAKKVPH
jgi:hypothetical protein